MTVRMGMEMKGGGKNVGTEEGNDIDGLSEYKSREELKVMIGNWYRKSQGVWRGDNREVNGVREVVAAHVLRKSRGERGPKFNRGGSVLHDEKTCEMNLGAVI